MPNLVILARLTNTVNYDDQLVKKCTKFESHLTAYPSCATLPPSDVTAMSKPNLLSTIPEGTWLPRRRRISQPDVQSG